MQGAMLKALSRVVDLRAVAAGLALCAAVYGGLALYAVIAGPGHMAALSAQAHAQTVPVEWFTGALAEKPVPVPNENHGDPHEAAPAPGHTQDPFTAHRLPAPEEAAYAGRVAIMVVDYGLSEAGSRAALDALPEGTGLALSPYSAQAQDWANRAGAAGKELWLLWPTARAEAEPGRDPGPLAFTPDAGVERARGALHGALAAAQGYAGVALFVHDGFPADSPALYMTMDDILGRGLGLVQLEPAGAGGAADPLAAMAGLRPSPYARADAVLVPETLDALPGMLEAAAEHARARGQVLIVVPPWPTVLEPVGTWARTLRTQGLVLVPVSALAAPESTPEEALAAEHPQEDESHGRGH